MTKRPAISAPLVIRGGDALVEIDDERLAEQRPNRQQRLAAAAAAASDREAPMSEFQLQLLNKEQQDPDAERIVHDILHYPFEPPREEPKNPNEALCIDSTAELLLASLKKNSEMGFPLTARQMMLLKEIARFVQS